MGNFVSVRIQHSKNFNSNHDLRLRKNEKFIDHSKSHLNKIIATDHNVELESPKPFFRNLLARLKRSIKNFSNSEAGRKWQDNSPNFIRGIISFGTVAAENGKLDDKEQLDSCATDFINKFRQKHDLRDDALVYLTRHEDEQTTHYHFELLQQKKNGKSARRDFNNVPYSKEERKNDPSLKGWKVDKTAEIQDLAGLAFAPMGLERGIKKAVREEKTPDLNTDYVSPKEYRAKTEQERKLVLQAKTALAKKIVKVNSINEEKVKKLEKRFFTYLKRAVNHINLNQEQAQKNIALLGKNISDFEKLGLVVSVSEMVDQLPEKEKTTEMMKVLRAVEKDIEDKKNQPLPPKNKSSKFDKNGTKKKIKIDEEDDEK